MRLLLAVCWQNHTVEAAVWVVFGCIVLAGPLGLSSMLAIE